MNRNVTNQMKQTKANKNILRHVGTDRCLIFVPHVFNCNKKIPRVISTVVTVKS